MCILLHSSLFLELSLFRLPPELFLDGVINQKELLFLLIHSNLRILPLSFLRLQPLVIILDIFLNTLVPLFQILAKLLPDFVLQFLLLYLKPIKLNCIQDLDIRQRVFVSNVSVYVEFQPANVVHVLVVDFGFLHLVRKNLVLKRLEYLVPDVQVYVQFLNSRNQVLLHQLKLQLVYFLYYFPFQQRNNAFLIGLERLYFHFCQVVSFQ